MAGVFAPLGMRLAFAENAVKVSVVRDIPLLELATGPHLAAQDLRAQLRRGEDQRLDPDRVDVELDRICSCIGPVGPLICLVMRNTQTIGERIATALAPSKRIRVCPNRVGLTAEEKVGIKFVRLRGALVRLKVE